jgi:hypothetical protein
MNPKSCGTVSVRSFGVMAWLAVTSNASVTWPPCTWMRRRSLDSGGHALHAQAISSW